jgi:hypothetical protein
MEAGDETVMPLRWATWMLDIPRGAKVQDDWYTRKGHFTQ